MNFSFYFGLRSYTRLFISSLGCPNPCKTSIHQSQSKHLFPGVRTEETLYRPFYFNYTTSPIFDVDLGALFRGLYSLDRSSVFIVVPLLTVMGCTDPPSLLGARRPVPRDKAFVTLTRRWTAGEDSINALIFMSFCTKPRVVYLSIGQRLVTWALCAFTNTRQL